MTFDMKINGAVVLNKVLIMFCLISTIKSRLIVMVILMRHIFVNIWCRLVLINAETVVAEN